MLIAGAVILMACKVNTREIANGAVFKAGMTAIISVFGVAWMSDTFFESHFTLLKNALAGVVATQPWMYAIVLFLVSKLVNSQEPPWRLLRPWASASGWIPK